MLCIVISIPALIYIQCIARHRRADQEQTRGIFIHGPTLHAGKERSPENDRNLTAEQPY